MARQKNEPTNVVAQTERFACYHAAITRQFFSHDRLGPNKSYQPIKIVNREIRNTF